MAGQQQEEIETIRSRTIEVKLSDADVKRISEKAAAHGLTVGELIENFIGDLVCGTYSNGSDERMYAEQWFERCWFGMFPDLTFLRYPDMLMCGKVSQENYVELTAASAMPNKEIKSPQILRC